MYRESLFKVFFGKTPMIAFGITLLVVLFAVLSALASCGDVN